MVWRDHSKLAMVMPETPTETSYIDKIESELASYSMAYNLAKYII